MPKRLCLTMIDGFHARFGQTELPLPQIASRQLLAHLALHPNMAESRSRLATLLWENSDEVRGRRNFRQLLFSLRAETGADWTGLTTTRDGVALDPKAVQTDVGEVLMLLKSGNVPEMLTTSSDVPGRLLSDLPSHGELFTSYVQIARRDFENKIRAQLEIISARGDAIEQSRAAQAMLCLDRADETAARFLIQAAMAKGNSGRALKNYADLWAHLDDEYGMEPAAETQELITQVKMQPQYTAPQMPPSAAPRTHYSIGILPAAFPSADTQSQAISHLFRSELMMRLMSFREFSIVDTAISGAATDYQLGLVFAPIGDTVEASATLIQMDDGAVVWGKQLGQVLPNWWTHQAEIAGLIAAACSTTLSRARLARIADRAGEPGVIDHWTLGQAYLFELRPDRWTKAEECYQTCITLDPRFSMGYSSLSQLYHGQHLACPGTEPNPAKFAESKLLANKAIAFDPLDSRAHLCRAWSSCLLREYEQAAASFALARECNENDPWTVLSSALGASFGGDQALADQLSGTFLAKGWTTTMPQWGFHATIRFLAGDDAGCIQAADNAGGAILNIPAWKAAACWHLGRKEDASRAWETFETGVREVWTGPETPTTKAILHWFLSCFPIRSDAQVSRLKQGVTRAAERYMH